MSDYPTAPGRVPPHSAKAEEGLLSCCILDGGDTIDRCIDQRIDAPSFYVPANRVIYEKLCEINAAKKPVDFSVLCEELRESRQLDEIGGYAYLTRVSDAAPTTAQAGYYIEKVRELALLRDTIRASTANVEEAYGYSGGIDDFLSGVEQRMFSVTQARVPDGARHVSESAKGAMALCRRMIANPNEITGLATGFKDLDRKLGGLRGGEMIILAGRPSCGKTALALNMGENMALPYRGAGVGGLVFSIEMSAPQLALRLITCRARVSWQAMRSGFIRPASEEVRELERAEADLARSHLYIDDSTPTAGMIRARARRAHAKKPLGFIIVDYLQLIDQVKGQEIREQVVADSSRQMKAMAKELGIPVIVLAQLNRSAEKENRAPRLSDLRESGSIEQDADVVLMLNRPKDEDAKFQVAASVMDLAVAKNRNGEVGEIKLTFINQITRFENYTQ